MTQAKSIIVLTTTPDLEHADNLARQLLSDLLAACVNISPPVQSVYYWDNKLQHDTEYLLIIKTAEKCYQALEQAIQKYHPYDIPEIIAIPIQQGLSSYLDWINKSTRAP